MIFLIFRNRNSEVRNILWATYTFGKVDFIPKSDPSSSNRLFDATKIILFAIHTYLERSGVESTTKNLEIFAVHLEELYLSYQWLDAVLWVK